MKNLRKRFFLTISMVVFGVCLAMAQPDTIRHTVERGETLSSIAKLYSTTEAKIIELNPDAAQFIYVGMVLIVPDNRERTENVTTEKETTTNSMVLPTNATDNNLKTSNSKIRGRFGPAFEIGYGFLKGGSGHWQFEASAGVNYYFKYGFYAGARIGYSSANSSAYIKQLSGTQDVRIHLIEVPIEIGYPIHTSNQMFGVIPFGGIDTNIGLTGKYERNKHLSSGYEKQKYKIGGKIGLGARLGVRLMIGGLNISGAYHFPLNNKQKGFFGKDAYPELSIGFGF